MVTGRYAGRRSELVDRLRCSSVPSRGGRARASRRSCPGWQADLAEGPVGALHRSGAEGCRAGAVAPPTADGASVISTGDAASRTRSPAAVKVPSGAFQDIFDAWAGEHIYDPGLVRAPVAIIRGEWDNYADDADAHGLFGALRATPEARHQDRPRHASMHLEAMRGALYRREHRVSAPSAARAVPAA